MKHIAKMLDKYLRDKAERAFEDLKKLRNFRMKDGNLFAITSVALSEDKKTLTITLMPMLETEEENEKK